MSHNQREITIQELDNVMKATSNQNIYQRCQTVRLHFDGFVNIDIANIVHVNPQTGGVYISKYKEHVLSALTPALKVGTPSKLSKDR